MLRVQDIALLLAFIGLKIWLLFAWPLLGNEAYWIGLADHAALGYYDQPPMLGWLLAIMQTQSDALWWYRSVGFLSAVALSWGIFVLLSVAEPSLVFRRRHMLAALAFFVSPASLFLITTSPHALLALFGFAGVAFYAVAVIRRAPLWAAFAGLFLGAALLSSPWAMVLFLGLVVFSVFHYAKVGWLAPVLAGTGVFALGAIGFAYNFTHCWNHVLYGVFLPLEEAQFGYENLLAFLAVVLLFIGPWSVWYWRRCGARYTGIWQSDIGRVVSWSALPYLGVLLLVSLWHSVGLHWPILAIPVAWLVFRALPEAALLGLFRWSAACSLVIVGLVAMFLQDPARWLGPNDRHSLALFTQTEQACAAIAPIEGPLFTLGQSSQAVIGVACKRPQTHIFASLSKFGREDDLNVDLKALDGAQLHLLLLGQDELVRIEPFFESIETQPIAVGASSYLLAKATGFRYDAYRTQILTPVVRRFYEAPYWFPQPGGCPVKERYGL